MTDGRSMSRRGFVQGATLTSAAMLVGQPGVAQADSLSAQDSTAAAPGGELNFTTDSAALQPDKTIATACQFCNALRGMIGMWEARTGRAIIDLPISKYD